jgi:hypothetical protein
VLVVERNKTEPGPVDLHLDRQSLRLQEQARISYQDAPTVFRLLEVQLLPLP